MNHAPLLSIIVPTRNRANYAFPLALKILASADDRFELVLSDAGDDDVLKHALGSALGDSRLRYVRHDRPLSLVDNFQAAMEFARGEYVCFLGDDDGVNPEISDAAEWALDNRLDGVRANTLVRYFWPDMKQMKSLSHYAGSTIIDSRFSCAVEDADPEAALHQLAHNGGQNYQMLELPKVYHGLVHKHCFEQLASVTGAYFRGLSPDIYGAVAVARFAQRIVTLDYPITIDGTGAGSGAGASARRRHHGSLATAPHLKNQPHYFWAEQVPRFYSVETIWADSAIAALLDTGRSDIADEFSLPALVSACLLNYPEYAYLIVGETLRIAEAKPHLRVALIADVIRKLILQTPPSIGRKLYRQIRYKLNMRAAYIKQYEDVLDSATAMNCLSRYLQDTNKSFVACIKAAL